MIEPVYWCETDEELRAGRVRIRFARHRDHAVLMRMIVKLGFDLVTWATSSVAVFFCRIFRIRVAALDHEPFDEPAENGAVVETEARQLLETLDLFWRGISPELLHHIAFAGSHPSDLLSWILE